jgi:hypothetical protein
LEPALQGRDLIARAKTGTGKTLAFGIPVIQHIVNENERDRIARAEPFFSLVHSVEENKRNAIARSEKDSTFFPYPLFFSLLHIVEETRTQEHNCEL